MKRIGRLSNLVAAPHRAGVAAERRGLRRRIKPNGAATGNVIQSIDVSTQGGSGDRQAWTQGAAGQSAGGFTVNNPPRIAFDFPNTATAWARTPRKSTRAICARSASGSPAAARGWCSTSPRWSSTTTRIDGKTVIITCWSAAATAAAAASDGHHSFAEAKGDRRSRTHIQRHRFPPRPERRGADHRRSVRYRHRHRSAAAGPQRHRRLPADRPAAGARAPLRRHRLRHPGRLVRGHRAGRQHAHHADAKGRWEQSAYQTDNRFIIEVKPVVEDPEPNRKTARAIPARSCRSTSRTSKCARCCR